MKMKKDFDVFLQANEGRIYYQMHRLKIPRDLYEEFYAEGIVALWNAYKKYDPTKGEVGTFINYQLRFRFLDLIRKSNRDQERLDQAQHERIVQIDDGNRSLKTGLPIVQTSGIQLNNEEFWAEVRTNLSDKQWKWVYYYVIANLTIKEIIEIEGVSADAVKSWGRETRRKLRRSEIKERLESLL